MNRDPIPDAKRVDYRRGVLLEADAGDDPFALFSVWYREACADAAIVEPNGMTLATVDASARPAARVVLMKAFDRRGLVFFTNYASRKGRELEAHPAAAAVLWWQPHERQVRFEGRVERTSVEESEAYFASRPVEARCAAVASRQSEVLADRAELERRFEALNAAATPPARPEHWGGYRLLADVVEFWQGRPSRLHDRLRFVCDGTGWRRERLSP
jgi:pyridoxamine 5'-phosphate oxidase